MPGNVAIDGPAGAGKSTVAKKVAQRLGYLYVDTGAMYRALTWKALSAGADLDDEQTVVDLAAQTVIELSTNAGGNLETFCDGKNVTTEIRTPLVSQNVSRVARYSGVRRRMVDLQRKMAEAAPVVMDGRDIGSFVLPDAPYKFFLTASLDERARRRCLQLAENNVAFSAEAVRREISRRDEMDSARAIAPLVQAPDAVLVDTSCLSVEQVVDKIIQLIGRG